MKELPRPNNAKALMVLPWTASRNIGNSGFSLALN